MNLPPQPHFYWSFASCRY